MIEWLKNKGGELASAGVDKVKELVNEIDTAGPVLRQVGYRLRAIETELSLSPRVILHLDREFEAPEEAFKAALLNNEGRKTVSLIIRSLQQANSLQARMGLKGYDYQGVEMEVALSPALRLRFVEKAVPGLPGA
jgi:hypothetical protein